jgi:trehalose 2-sulfotransferase
VRVTEIPDRCYWICSTPRTGSQFLCEILKTTGLLGTPEEYFQRDHCSLLFERFGAFDYETYLNKVLGQTSTPNGVFGAKVMGGPYLEDFFRQLRALPSQMGSQGSNPEFAAELFPGLRYIWLTRRDKLRQAISLSKALQTGVWQSHVGSKESLCSPVFSWEAVNQLMGRLALDETTWQEYFTSAGVEPLSLVYEDLIRSPESTVRRILEYLDISIPSDWSLDGSRSRSQRLADDESERWVEAFRRQTRTPPVPEATASQGPTAQLGYEHLLILQGWRPQQPIAIGKHLVRLKRSAQDGVVRLTERLLMRVTRPGKAWPSPHISVIFLSPSLKPQKAWREWLDAQTLDSTQGLLWCRKESLACDLADEDYRSAEGFGELRGLIKGRYVCFMSPYLLTREASYLETNLAALETEELDFTCSESPPSYLSGGQRLPGAASHFQGLIMNVDALSDELTLNRSDILGKVTAPPDSPDASGWETHEPFRITGDYMLFGKRARPKRVRDLKTQMAFSAKPDDRPTVLVCLPFLAVGGAEQLAANVIGELSATVRFVVLATDRRPPGLGDGRPMFRHHTPLVYTPADAVHDRLLPDFINYLIDRYEPQCLYIANGSSRIYDRLPSLRSEYPKMRIVNQVYDDRAGWINRYNTKWAHFIDAHIGANQKICQAYTERGAPSNSVHLVHHGVDCAKFAPSHFPEACCRELKERFELPTDRKIISFLSRLHPQKRPFDFVELARQMQHDPSVFFFMAAEGPLGEALEKTLTQLRLTNLRLRPFHRPNTELLAVSDIVVLPSEHEGMPLVVLESQAMGRSVIATDVGNTAEILSNTGGGRVLSAIGQVGSMRMEVQSLLLDPPDPVMVRKAARSHYDIKKIAKDYLSVLLPSSSAVDR